jgi:hypothetical protein
MSETTNQPKDVELTPEQIAERRAQLKEFYENQMDLLRPQLEYETTLAAIEEQRFKRMTMIIRQAEMSMGPKEEKEQRQTEGEEKKERTLKKD